MDKIDMVLSKLFSARFWMALIFSATACLGFLHKILTPAEFMTLAGVVIHAYFTRQEDKPEPGPVK